MEIVIRDYTIQNGFVTNVVSIADANDGLIKANEFEISVLKRCLKYSYLLVWTYSIPKKIYTIWYIIPKC